MSFKSRLGKTRLDRVAADVANVRTFELAIARLEGLLGRHAGEDC